MGCAISIQRITIDFLERTGQRSDSSSGESVPHAGDEFPYRLYQSQRLSAEDSGRVERALPIHWHKS